MDNLKEIYDRITRLRRNGVRMKDIAARVDYPPSVLSALFSTVLPAYIKNRDEGMAEAEALDNALTWVNNVSKKKLTASVGDMLHALTVMEKETVKRVVPEGNPFATMLKSMMRTSAENIRQFCGVYMSYSKSSSTEAMKIEPYLIAPSVDGSFIEVVHNNAYGSSHTGFALMNGLSHLYITFNENSLPQLSLFNICLRLPMYDRPRLLRGLYTCFDYNYNPVARRILFVKQSDNLSRTDFSNIGGCLKTKGQLSEEERAYYDYTCGRGDIIRMCNIPSPSMTAEDLSMEKQLLDVQNGKK